MSKGSEEGIERTRLRALQILANTRVHGARFYWEYMGVHPSAPRNGVCDASMLVEPYMLGPRGFVHTGVLATMADNTIAAAIRPSVPNGHRTATVGLTLQTLREIGVGEVRARAEMISISGRTAAAKCSLTDGSNNPVALAAATFALRPVPEDSAWLPYSRDNAIDASPAPPLVPEELSPDEKQLLRRVEESITAGGSDGAYANFLGIEWQDRGSGRAAGVWPLGGHLWNRATHVHGGALFGALETAAQACLPEGTSMRIVEQHTQYVRPGMGDRLRVEATLLRQGRQLSAVTARIMDEAGDTVAAALVTLESAGL